MPVLHYAVIGVALLAMVWPSAPPRALASLAGSAWRIVEIDGARAPGGGTVRFTHTSVRGKGPCNTFFGAFREARSAIEIGGVNETRMHCAGRMEIERTFLDGLARVRSWRSEADTIVLLDAAGKPVLRLAG